jgi:hypothetical protein
MPSPTITAPSTFPTNINPVVSDDATLIEQIAKSIPTNKSQAENLQIIAAIKTGKITPDSDVNKRCHSAGKQPGVGSMIEKTGVTSGVSVAAGAGFSSLAAAGSISSLAAGAATAGIGALLAVGFMIIEHHKAAVQREDATLCDLVPKINTTIANIDAAFAAGQITAAQASTTFAQLHTLTLQALSGIFKSCNAACLLGARLKAIGMYRTISYQRIESARAAAAASSSSGVLGATGTAGGLGTAALVIAGTAALVH